MTSPSAAKASIRKKNIGALRWMIRTLPLDIVIWKNAKNWEQFHRAKSMHASAVAELRRREAVQADRVSRLPELIADQLRSAPQAVTGLSKALHIESELVSTALGRMLNEGEVTRSPHGRYELVRTRKAA